MVPVQKILSQIICAFHALKRIKVGEIIHRWHLHAFENCVASLKKLSNFASYAHTTKKTTQRKNNKPRPLNQTRGMRSLRDTLVYFLDMIRQLPYSQVKN